MKKYLYFQRFQHSTGCTCVSDKKSFNKKQPHFQDILVTCAFLGTRLVCLNIILNRRGYTNKKCLDKL